MANERYAQFRNFSTQKMSFAEKRKVWLEISDMTEESFDAMLAENKARQSRVPPVGQPAPDFEIERLTASRAPTGEFVRLADFRGRPVSLVFGSYT